MANQHPAPHPTEAVGVRLHVAEDLGETAVVILGKDQAHYLHTVMRRGVGEAARLFNGRDGEWSARIMTLSKTNGILAVRHSIRPQVNSPDMWLLFAPLKRAPIDDLARGATELGVSALRPILTHRTVVARVDIPRLLANTVEAAQRCQRLDVPVVAKPSALDDILATWPAGRRLLLCDETGVGAPIARVLARLEPTAGRAPWAVLTGPEGGFTPVELDGLRKLPFVTPVGLGPRILRTGTAALAALACWQSLVGDWVPGGIR
jgi:16S rRNA (uracil1498-N3)-methyltransferase